MIEINKCDVFYDKTGVERSANDQHDMMIYTLRFLYAVTSNTISYRYITFDYCYTHIRTINILIRALTFALVLYPNRPHKVALTHKHTLAVRWVCTVDQ
jgi:hypothetical protein